MTDKLPTRQIALRFFPRDIASAVLAKTCLSYVEAHDHVSKTFRRKTARNHYPYERLSRLDDYLYTVPLDFPEWKAFDRPNAGKNCTHVELENGLLTITTSAVRHPNQIVRSAVFRNSLAQGNVGLQLDFFEAPNLTAYQTGDLPVYGLILHGPDPRNLSRPAFFNLAFLNDTGDCYIDNIDLLAIYKLRVDSFYESTAPVEEIKVELDIEIKPETTKRRAAQ